MVKVPFLEVENLTKRFGGLVAVNNLSFNVERGEIVGLIGPNGAGKTTVFNLITGLLHKDSGSIRFQGHEISTLHPHEICKRGIGRTFQIVQPFANLTVFDTVIIAALNTIKNVKEAKAKAEKVLDLLGIYNKGATCKDLTLVFLKRLEIARAIATEPKLLLLDESMAGLNPAEMDMIMSLIKQTISEMDITIFLIEHVMRAVMGISDRIVVIHHGEKISEGRPQEVANDRKVIDAYLGERITL